jgi:hypothetical protein
MLSCYLDESTAFGETDPATSVAGYVATGKQWHTFSHGWNRMLKEYGVEIFHTTELETEAGRRRSVYRDWSRKKREQFQNDIIDIIRACGLYDVGIAIPRSVYNSVATPERIKKFGPTPDGLCAILALMQAAGFALDNKAIYKQAPSFFYESGGRCKKALTWAYNELANNSKLYEEFFQLSRLAPAPKSKEFPQLQAADYLAFNVSKRASHVVDPNPPSDAILETLADGKKVRKMRYPLLALYGKEGGNIFHAPTVGVLEKMLQVLEAHADQTDKV